MRDLPIVDAHVHLWELPQFPRPWLKTLPALNRPFGLADYQQQTRGLPITGMVYVETDVAPSHALLEAQWAVSLAQTDARLQGVVAAAPVERGLQVRPYLEALAALGPLVKGVRRNLQGELDPNFCLREDFVTGVRLLGAFGFSFDLCIRHDQLPMVTSLVGECPDILFVLDHLGKPAIRDGRLEPWHDQVAALAALPNVVCKLSGLVTEADWNGWRSDDLAPYIAQALTVFGPSRVLFASDWPVLTLASTYQHWIETLNTVTGHLNANDLRLLWSENACHWYRLPPLVESQ
jgi:predicted TIM-barrel fold metal-dependent hydrolase